MTDHLVSHDTDPGFRALIRPHTGELADVRPIRNALMSDLTAMVTCEKGPFFVKAMRNRPGGRRESLIREKLINPFVRPFSPALRWTAEDEDWIVLGFEAVHGRSADIRPGSPDLPVVAELLDGPGGLGLPDVARGWTEVRWDRFAADREEAELFRGDALLHADVNHTNLLIGERAWAVDWGWPTRGAALVDPACLVVQLVAAGHDPASAEAWAARCAAWADAEPRAVDAFAAAEVRMWREMAAQRPDRRGRRALAEAAASWAAHRGVSAS